MSEIIHERRRLLLSTAAWVGGLAAVAANRLARAFQVEEMPPTGAVGRAYANRCSSGSPEHNALIARLQALLANDPSAASMTATCPILRLPGDRQPVGGPVKQASCHRTFAMPRRPPSIKSGRKGKRACAVN